jgi:hypothetical protein
MIKIFGQNVAFRHNIVAGEVLLHVDQMLPEPVLSTNMEVARKVVYLNM